MNLNKRNLGLLATLAALAANGVLAEDSFLRETHWKDVGQWQVSYFENEGCQLYTTFDDGTAIWMGFSRSDEPLFGIWLANESWTSIEDGKDYELTVKFGKATPWDIEMSGFVWDNDLHGVLNENSNAEQVDPFLEEFMSATAMEWTFEGRQIGKYSLSGSRRAIGEVFACQESFEKAMGDDPFARANAADPFSATN